MGIERVDYYSELNQDKKINVIHKKTNNKIIIKYIDKVCFVMVKCW